MEKLIEMGKKKNVSNWSQLSIFKKALVKNKMKTFRIQLESFRKRN